MNAPIEAAGDKRRWLHFGILALVVLLAYLRVFHAGFMYWDDGEYVLNNKDITSITGENINAWFSHYYVGNYHPLTMLSYAMDFALGAKKAFHYHLTSVLLHIINTLLVYTFIRKLRASDVVALFVALLFALHPVQTESVSWIAERKTILCATFFLLSLLQYIRYAHKPSMASMALFFVFGAMAMLSKAVAVALPLSFVAIDIWLNRDLRNWRLWVEKLPLVALGVVIGLTAIKAQSSAKFLGLHPEYGIWDSILFAAYAYVMYIVRLIAPVGLSVIYPYPAVGALLHVHLAIAVGIVVLAAVAWKRKWYVLAGGILFYTVNIVLLLQFVQFGESLMADRYLYIPCIGILYPIVHYTIQWLQKMQRQLWALVSLSVVSATLVVCTYVRNDIWKSDFNFFHAILDTYPTSSVAQYSVGVLYMKMGRFIDAQEHIDLAVQLDPNNYKAWHSKGSLHLRQGQVMPALDALNRSIDINDYPKAYFSRALLFQGTHDYQRAIADIDHVLQLQPQNARAFCVRADCLEKIGDNEAAMSNYTTAIDYDSNEPVFFIRRGILRIKLKLYQLAVSDFDAAISRDATSGEAYYSRGIANQAMGHSPCEDLNMAVKYSYRPATEALAKFCNH